MTNTTSTIDEDHCSVCGEPAHASETDDDGRCITCMPEISAVLLRAADLFAEVPSRGVLMSIYSATKNLPLRAAAREAMERHLGVTSLVAWENASDLAAIVAGFRDAAAGVEPILPESDFTDEDPDLSVIGAVRAGVITQRDPLW